LLENMLYVLCFLAGGFISTLLILLYLRNVLRETTLLTLVLVRVLEDIASVLTVVATRLSSRNEGEENG